ncbi:MAG: hypothetical protein GXP25_17670 [Planctomycetes bacterium]|nr:hypothetical protein [Planctomycetota bacterium]
MPKPIVEIEENVYTYEPADNGADPMWCLGNTCIVRVDDSVFASGLETLKQFKRLNNVRWLLFKRETAGWKLQQADEKYRTREPCPLGCFPGGPLFLSVNPAILTDSNAEGGSPARPEVLEFSVRDPKAPYKAILPQWNDKPAFREHSYRTFSVDGPNREFILFQNIGTDHSEWAFRDCEGRWFAGQLPWKKREDTSIAPYHSKRARANYPCVVLKNREVHFCGASAYNKWDRVNTMELAGRKWGNRWRRLRYVWTPDITKQKFSDWIEIANTQKHGGWLFAEDLWLDPEGVAHLLWVEQPIHWKLRKEHFPDIKRTWALKYAQIREGKILLRKTLVETGEGISHEALGGTGGARFHVTPDHRLFLLYYVFGKDEKGKAVSENRLMEIFRNGETGQAVRVPMKHPMSQFFTATPRGGSAPSMMIDLLGVRAGAKNTISYARVKLE